MSESLLMVWAAMKAGISSIVCTPHCRDPWFDYEAMWQAFYRLKSKVDQVPGAPSMSMGFEVNYRKLIDLGVESAEHLGNQQGEFLLELPTSSLPLDWQRVVFQLQGMGYHNITIAHPERYHAVQKDLDVAREFIAAGCKLQLSANCITGGWRDTRRRTAKKLVEEGLITCIASDAHCPADYEVFTEARRQLMGSRR